MLLAALTVIFAFLNYRSLNLRQIVAHWPAKVMVGLGVMACLSVPFGISMGNSALYIIKVYSKVLIIAFLLIAAIRDVRDLATFVWAYVAGCAALAWMTLFVFQLREVPGQAYRVVELHTFDANDAGAVMLLGVGLTLVLIQASRGLRKYLAVALLVAIGLSLSRLGSRGTLLAIIVVGLYLLFSIQTVSLAKRGAFIGALALALFLGAPEGYWQRMGTLLKPTETANWTNTDGRRHVARRGLGYMFSYPLFGIGIDNFGKAECFISEKAEDYVPGNYLRCVAPHNSFVQAGAELGLPGLLLYSMLVLGGIPAMYRLRRRLPVRWARGDPEERFLYWATIFFPAGLVGYAISSFFVSLAFSDPIHIFAALIAGLYVAVRHKLPAHKSIQPLKSRSHLVYRHTSSRNREVCHLRGAEHSHWTTAGGSYQQIREPTETRR